MSENEQKLNKLTGAELLDLYNDAEELRNSGVLPMDSKLRSFTEEIFGDSDILHMTTVSMEVYRKMAEIFVALVKYFN